MSKISIKDIKGTQVNIGESVHAVQNINKHDEPINSRKIFHIIGEYDFGMSDESILKGSGADLITVMANSQLDVLKELNRQREDDKIIPNIHVSAHGNTNEGILLNRQWVDADSWRAMFSNLDQIEIMFLAACESVEVADIVAGTAKWVIATTKEIYDHDAIKATGVFWRHIMNNKSADEAFDVMRKNIPEFSQHMRIRGV